MSADQVVEQILDKGEQNLFDGLNDEQRQALVDSCLFPDTHVEFVEILGKKREFSPLTIKWAKKLDSILKPCVTQLADAPEVLQKVLNAEPTKVESNVDLYEVLVKACLLLCERYGWADLSQAIEEEDVLLKDLQAMVTVQKNVQGASDFLALGLRTLCFLLQNLALLGVQIQGVMLTPSPTH